MSDKDFDDTLLDDFSEEGETFEDGSDKDKQGSLKKGLLVGIIMTLLFEVAVTFLMDVQTNLLHRYIAYMMGMFTLIVVAFLIRSQLKMFVAILIIVPIGFILPYFLPSFSGLMTPFLPLVSVLNNALDNFNKYGVSAQGIEEYKGIINTYGILLDLGLAILIATIAALGTTSLAKLVFNKKSLLTIFTSILGLIFFIIGVVVLPYVVVATSGIAHFGMAFGTGANLLSSGMTEANAENGSLELANSMFTDAEEWFAKSEQMLEGLQSMGLFWLMSSTSPGVRIIVDNGVILLKAAVNLAQGIAPALSGIGSMNQGMSGAMDSLNTTSALASEIQLSQSTSFEDNIDQIERGFSNFTSAIDNIKQALNEIQQIDRDELTNALSDMGLADQTENINTVFSTVDLLNVTLDVFSNPDGSGGLIDDPDGIENDEQRAPIVHLLLGARVMDQVRNKIGENSEFRNTRSDFQELIGHLQHVVDATDPAQNSAINDLENLDVSSSEQISDMKDKMLGSINFLRDAGNTTIGIGQFGIIASPTLTSMNQSLSVITGAADFTTISQQVYQNQIDMFDGNSTLSLGITENATRMQTKAANIKQNIDTMETNVNNDTYGYFGDPAQSFVNSFRQFNLTRNADNFFYLSHAFSSLLKATKEISSAKFYINNIEGNVTVIEGEVTAFESGNISDVDLLAMNDSVSFIQDSIISANTSLGISSVHLLDSSGNFSLVRNMTQLEGTGPALANISEHVVHIQVGRNATIHGLTGINTNMTNIEGHVDQIITLATDGTPNEDQAPEFQAEFTGISDNLTSISDELVEITFEYDQVQSELGKVSIAGD